MNNADMGKLKTIKLYLMTYYTLQRLNPGDGFFY